MIRKTMEYLKGAIWNPWRAYTKTKARNAEATHLKIYADKKLKAQKFDCCAEILGNLPSVDNTSLTGVLKK